MSDENKKLVRRVFEEGLNAQNFHVFRELLSREYVNHNLATPSPGPAGFEAVASMFITAFPDLRIRIEDVIAEADKVVTRGVFAGTHQGTFMNVPPTGKAVTVGYIDIWRIDNGRAVENWVQMDLLSLMQQLGVVADST